MAESLLVNYFDLAEDIASDFSSDAGFWPPRYISSPSGESIGVCFRFFGTLPSYGLDLLKQLTSLLSEPYTAEDRGPAASLIITSEEKADVIITLSEELYDEELALHYEVWSRHAQDAVDMGSFYLHPYQPE